MFHHNLSLSIASAALLVGLVYDLSSMVAQSGWQALFCDARGEFVNSSVYWIYYLNYLTKWWELGETLLLAIRGRPTPFLHVYHHSATLVLCWTQLVTQTCLQWLVMYYYFALHTLGYRPSWKRWVTVAQIAQFVIDVAVCVGAFVVKTAAVAGFSGFPNCHGTYDGCVFGVFILVSYLVLFLRFYDETYSDSRRKKPF
jgi:hypothetical protein